MHSNIIDKIMQGNVLAAARMIRDIEDGLPDANENIKSLYPHIGKAYIIGVTGAPGTGKSTIISALIRAFRKKDKTVGVVAVDPTSPFTGGALLGDRLRMLEHSTDPGVFIRSVAARGWMGGLSRTTTSIVNVLDAMGKDIILVETVGMGQAEVGISRIADTTLFVLSPSAGDSIQMMKAGIIEVADIFVINKADQQSANHSEDDLSSMISLMRCDTKNWIPPVVFTDALRSKGISELLNYIEQHWDWLISSNILSKRRRERARLELMESIESSILDYIKEKLNKVELEKLVEALLQRQSDPYSAAREIVNRYLK